MYKIYINDNMLLLADLQHKDKLENTGIKCLPYMGNPQILLNYVDKLEKTRERETILLYTQDLKQLWKDFKSLFKYIKAAGGVIYNDVKEILFIERLERWDLPKGKVDKEESYQEAAIREVEEETGLLCKIVKSLSSSYHTYRLNNGKRVLKRTYWYAMEMLDGEVVLQEEEHITAHMWCSAEIFLDQHYHTYASIRGLVEDL